MIFKLDDVVFGGPSEALIVTDFDPGSTTLRTNDTDRPQADGAMVGKDFLSSKTWTWDISTNGKSLSDSLLASSALEAAWRNPATRLNPNQPVALRYQINGQWRRVYGRPQEFAGVYGNTLAKAGAGRITCSFRVTDLRHYEDAVKLVSLSIVPASTGGMITPLITPLTTRRSNGVRAGFITNTGNVDTPLEIKFFGPVVNPYIQSASGWRVGYVGTLAYDQSVTINPFAGTVLRNDGVSVAGNLSRQTRLSKVLLPVGNSEITFGGSDITGTSKVQLSWRNAFSSL